MQHVSNPFDAYIDAALTLWQKKYEGMTIPAGDAIIFSLHYADDQVLLARDFKDTDYMIRI